MTQATFCIIFCLSGRYDSKPQKPTILRNFVNKIFVPRCNQPGSLRIEFCQTLIEPCKHLLPFIKINK